MDIAEAVLKASKPQSWWRRWLKRVLRSLLALVLVTICTLAFKHYQSSKRLKETLAEMDRDEPGWRLQDIEVARAAVPDSENSAPVIVAAAGLLPKGWPPADFSKQYIDLPPEELLGDEDFRRLKQELDRVQPALAVAAKIAEMPRGHHQLAYKRFVFDTLLPDQQSARNVATMLAATAVRHGQERDMKAALRSCRAVLNAGRSLGDEPLIISQLIRDAIVSLCCRGIERALAQGEPPQEEMAGLQPLLRDEDAFADLLVAARGERAALHEAFTMLESGEVPISRLQDRRPDWEDTASGWYFWEKFLAAHPTTLGLMNRWVAITQMPMHEQDAAEQEFDQEARKLRESDLFAVMLLPAAIRIDDASRRKHAYLRCTDAALACERYRREHKQWPASLASVCPHFLPAVPLDPFDGKPLRYQRLEEGVRIYSVGGDGTDNDGNLDRQNPTLPGMDIGVQLWDLAKRRQSARPRPKAPEPNLPPHLAEMPPR